jgi:hypothetical protein
MSYTAKKIIELLVELRQQIWTNEKAGMSSRGQAVLNAANDLEDALRRYWEN